MLTKTSKYCLQALILIASLNQKECVLSKQISGALSIPKDYLNKVLRILVKEKFPLDKPIVLLTMLNSIDLARVLLMLQLDVAALMGYTGATFQNFFGSLTGKLVSVASMLVWIFIPVLWGYRLFLRKDF